MRVCVLRHRLLDTVKKRMDTTFRLRFCPLSPGGGKQWIHNGDPVEIVGLFTEEGACRVPKRDDSSSGK